MRYFLGIDVGTSSVKTLLTDDAGTTVAVAQREYDIQKPRMEYAQQDMRDLWKATKETICEIVRNPMVSKEQIEAVGYSGQMHGLVMVDQNGELLQEAIIWCDQRSSKQVEKIYNTIGSERYKKITLNDLSTGFLLSSLLWVKEEKPEIYDKIWKIMLPKDYIRYRMCGNIGTDYSDASASLCFDTSKGEWAWELIEKLELREDIFPDCWESHEAAGEVNAECAKETGLKEGTLITYGGGDSLMQQIGNGVIDEYSPWIVNIGTSCSLNCIAGKPLHDSMYRTNTFCHVKRDRWMLMGANLCGGVVLKWLKDQVFHKKSYDEMTALAEHVPVGSDGLLFLPYLSGSRSPVNDPKAQGAYIGLTLGHTEEHMIRSAMEGIVLGMFTSYKIFENQGLSTEGMIASGGGARGELFLKMEADIFNKPVQVTDGNEQSCLGAAIAAAVGSGYYSGYQEACEMMVRFKNKIVLPDKKNHDVYMERYEVYKEIYSTNMKLFHVNRRVDRENV